MQPEKVTIQKKIIHGISVRTNNKDEQSQENGKIPNLWKEFFEKDLINNIKNQKESSPIFGIYSSYESDFNGEYNLTIGKEVVSEDTTLKYKEVSIENGEYLLFKNKGQMPNIVINTWQNIWKYFEDNNIVRKYTTDFELYKSEDEIEIYIAVK